MPTPAIIQTGDLPVVALVGRVNVGKSTLFNKMTETSKAIVSPIPGTTRTNNEAVTLWRGREFKLVDTGGLTFTDDVPLENAIIKQSEDAIAKADLIVLVTDAKDGILPQEKELAKRLRKIKNKPVLLIANKVDSQSVEIQMDKYEWSKLAMGEPFILSAANGRNLGNFLDLLYSHFSQMKRRPKTIKEEKRAININIIGKPNVGKSSLFNKLIGEEKAIVSPIAHTTREPHDTLISYQNQPINFVDTAGIRRKTKVSGTLERAGIRKSIQSIADSDLILFVIDGNETISSQDMQLAGLLEKKSKSVIILVSKWDLAENNSEKSQKEVKTKVLNHFPHLKFAPIMLISGKTGLNIHKIFPMIMKVWQARHTEIAKKDLEMFLKKSVRGRQPSRGKGTRHPELLGIQQLNAAPPIFELFIKPRTSVHRSYIQYLENRLREQFDFLGTPIVIKMTKIKK